MKNGMLIFVGAVALLWDTGALAQGSGLGSQIGGAMGKKADEAMTGKSATKFTGCLVQGEKAGEFKLTHVNGGTEEYDLVGGEGLKEHLGHKVEITAAKMEKEGAAEKASHEQLKVESMKHVAATCP
jgi:hypothetical protein